MYAMMKKPTVGELHWQNFSFFFTVLGCTAQSKTLFFREFPATAGFFNSLTLTI